MENCASLLRDASMEASPSPAAAEEASLHAEGKGTAAAAFAREQEQGFVGDEALDMRLCIPSRNPREQRSPWTAPRARKTRRRGDRLEDRHACRGAAGAPGARPNEKKKKRARRFALKPTRRALSFDLLNLFSIFTSKKQQRQSRPLRDAPLLPLAGNSSTKRITSSSRVEEEEEQASGPPFTRGWLPSLTTTTTTNRRRKQRRRWPLLSLLSGRASPAPRAGAATAAAP